MIRVGSRPVRVTRNGNARTLVIPADIAEAVQVEIGDHYQVEAAGDTLIYRRVSGAAGHGAFAGSGPDRVLELPRRGGAATGVDPAQVPPLDWDF
jgi:bifunctional DNA-binding transcriptional regulator/antitoxin component of YhaV-PrlF toxin-antitoxin module